MFTREITETPFTTPTARRVFGKIKAEKFNSDVSMTSTLRALLFRRMGGEEFFVSRARTGYSYETLRNHDPDDILAAVTIRAVYDGDSRNCLCINSFRSSEDACEEMFRIMDARFLSFAKERSSESEHSEGEGSSFSELEDLKEFFAQRHIQARFYINEVRKVCYVMVGSLDIKKWHLLQSLIPRYLPWWFEDQPLNEKEKELLKSLTNRYAPAYESAIKSIAEEIDVRGELIKASLKGFESQFEQIQLQGVRNKISSLREELASLNSQWTNVAQRIQVQQDLEFGLATKINSCTNAPSELMEYFLANKNLHLRGENNGAIEFVVTGYLDNFDPDQFEKTLDNPDSYMYRYAGGRFTTAQTKRLLTAIFGTEQIKMRVCAAYMLDFAQMQYGGIARYDFSDFSTYLPNPHIQLYRCLGGNEQYIREAVYNRDYVLAVANCAASAGNINFGDYTVGEQFIGALFYEDCRKKFLELPDGSVVAPVEAIAWLDGETQASEQPEPESPEETDVEEEPLF